jgi:hypothetical protein
MPKNLRDPKYISRAKSLRTLEAKHLEIIEHLVYGLDRPHPDLPGLQLGQPLSVESAATALKVRRAYIRKLLAEPIFKSAYSRAMKDRREAATPRAIAKLEQMLDEPKASDVIRAAKILLGEDAKGFGVNVKVNNQTNVAQTIRPGYVLRLPPDIPTPHTIEERPRPSIGNPSLASPLGAEPEPDSPAEPSFRPFRPYSR